MLTPGLAKDFPLLLLHNLKSFEFIELSAIFCGQSQSILARTINEVGQCGQEAEEHNGEQAWDWET